MNINILCNTAEAPVFEQMTILQKNVFKKVWKLANFHEDRLHAQPAGGSPGHQAQQHHVCHRSACRPQDSRALYRSLSILKWIETIVWYKYCKKERSDLKWKVLWKNHIWYVLLRLCEVIVFALKVNPYVQWIETIVRYEYWKKERSDLTCQVPKGFD